MKTYNVIMSYFWLLIALISFIIVTYNCFNFGFSRWGSYYVFTAVAVGMYFMKKWMMKRMAKHEAYLKEQSTKNQANA
ncbi:MAG: hypothetical protein EB023_02605 [Flavobacteriia bacterium]|nr:hypothetical protein [Flavobacteriia bacterium]